MAELPDASTCYELLAKMALIRRFEEEAGRQYQRAKAGGFLHLAVGEEATIVGTTSVMRDEDYLVGTYRTHGHAIARGTDPKNRDGRAVRARGRHLARSGRLSSRRASRPRRGRTTSLPFDGRGRPPPALPLALAVRPTPRTQKTPSQ